jgi:hypothetical protein
MPNVPNVPGVPTLTSYSAAPILLALSDAAFVALSFLAPRWGIFLDGVPALPMAKSVASFEYKQDWTISDYPVEEGGFQSYDKVQLPFECRVRITSSGSSGDRAALLAALDQIANSLDLYDVVTPERVYTSVNVHHMDYRRTATNGVGLLVVDLWLVEVRVTATATFTNTQQPGDSGQQGVGNVQPQAPSGGFDEAGFVGGVQ